MKLAAAGIALVLLAGCSSSETRSNDAASTPSAVESTLTSVSDSTIGATPTTGTPTSAASTTQAPSTTASPSSTSTTAAPAGPTPWVAIDPQRVDLPLAAPCCASNWNVPPSPALPAPGVPLADGVYAIDATWQANPADPVPMRIHRFVPCADLPDVCDGGNPVAPEDMGVDTSSSYPLTLPLSADLRVIYTGYLTNPEGEMIPATSEGDGTSLAALATAVDAAYEKRVASRMRAGEDAYAVMDDVAAHPGDGFTEAPRYAGTLLFTDGTAPPILFQGTPTRGADILGFIVLSISGGQPTLVVYAGFYS